LPSLSDDSDRPSTLPQPELNPLLNPVLSKNMGRWAEVYFTSPPEKRDEAVAQLIRELEGESSSSSLPSEEAPRLISETTQVLAKAPTSTVADQGQGSTCFWCGYVNRREYKFCGKCGEPLNAPYTDLRADRNGSDRNGQGREQEQEEEKRKDPEQDGFDLSAPSPRILPSFESSSRETSSRESAQTGFLRGETAQDTEENDVPILVVEPERSSFRPWIATVLAAVVVVIAFLAWHTSSSAKNQTGKNPSANDQAAGMESSVTPPAATSNEPAETSPARANNSASAQLPDSVPSKPAPAVPLASSPPRASPNENGAESAQITGKGAEELIQAQDFLDGRNGKPRNTPLAAEWLWKAVRKENVEATVLLSGLYLRGDGVEKSCDQARVLLDAAALKGRKDAADQLKNLSAFGCQ
jgi:hypothetical protein